MSERYDREEEPGRRGEERRRVARDDSAPRRVGEVREERGLEPDRGTSWTSVIFGWLAALGASLLLSGLVSAVVGAILGALGFGGGTEAGTTSLVGLLITLLLAFLIGGYVAGRLASRSGTKHGLLVALLALVVTLVLALLGSIVGLSFIDNLSNVTLPSLPSDVQGLGTILTVSGLLALLFPFIGGAIGGAWGARTGRRRP